MVAGFPEGTPLRRAMNFTYNHVAPLQFLRTTYKAGPLLALALAGLGGLAAARAAPWLRARGRALPARRAGGAGGAGRRRVLAARARAGARLAADLGPDPARLDRGGRPRGRDGGRGRPRGRAARASSTRTTTGAGRSTRSCPRSPSARWRCATRCPTPTCARSTCCGRSTGSCSSAARCPGQLGPLLDLLSARSVVAGADDDRAGSGAVARRGRRRRARPARRARRGVGAGAARAARGGDARRRRGALPRVRAWDRPGARPIVRLEADAGATVVDGSADALAGLAAFGALPPRPDRLRRRRERGRGAPRGRGRDLRLQPPARARRRADGAEPRRHAGRRRPVLARRGGARPVPGARQPTARPWRPTTARATCGCRSRPPTRSSPSGGRSRPSTATPRPTGRPTARSRRRATGSRSASSGRRDVDAIELLPYSDRRAKVTAVEVAGRTFPVTPGLEPARARAARRALAARADRPRDGAGGRARRARAGSASCASPACGCARRCARRCSPSARSRAATSTPPA